MMRGSKENQPKPNENPVGSPAMIFPISEIFSMKKTFILNSSRERAKNSEIPNLESDYFPRDEASSKFFEIRYSRARDFDCDCVSDRYLAGIRRNKKCLCQVIIFSLASLLVVLLFAAFSYHRVRPNGIDRYLKSTDESKLTLHYHDFSPVAVESNDRTFFELKNRKFSTFIRNGENNNGGWNLEEPEPLVETPDPRRVKDGDEGYENFFEKLIVVSDDRIPNRRTERSIDMRPREWSSLQREGFQTSASDQPNFKFQLANKLLELEKKIEVEKENFKANGKTVFQPFSLTNSPPAQGFSSPESESMTKPSGSGSGKKPGESEELGSWQYVEEVDGRVDMKDESYRPSPIYSTESDIFSVRKTVGGPPVPGPEDDPHRASIEVISLAEAVKRRTEKRKNLFVNSRVVGGLSDVRLPTGPDVTKPAVDVFETLKTGQQLSFSPSGPSQFFFPYQMCLFANPFPAPKTSIRSVQPRTFNFGTPPSLFPLSEKENKFWTPVSPQQNILSFSVNNYAGAPHPQRQQVYFSPSALSPFNGFFPASSPTQPMLVTNGPPPNSQPIFCTYLPPPSVQFPTVPGTADFSHGKCVDCQPTRDDPESPFEEMPFIDAGRMTLTCSDDNVSCRDGSTCVPIKNWCDNEVHCPDVSDESFCSCRERVARERLCDGYPDCPLGEDEAGCFGCPKSAFSCDSVITPESCIPLNKRCDGYQDCAMGNDEIDCSALFFQVHQNRSHRVSQGQGFLHRNWKGDWFPVCVDLGSDAWAREACLGELGYLPKVVDVDFAPVPDHYKGPFIVRSADGTPSLQDHCKGHLSTYVKCPPVKCGTTAQFHTLQEVENRLKRSSDFPTQFIDRKGKREETGRVVGGRESEPRAWPWAVAIYKDGAFLCGGVILDRIRVLTAAHCMEQYWKHFYEIRGGMLRRFSFSPMEQIRAVSAVIVHENYNPAIMSNDLALLRLKTPFHFNRWIRPACLPTFGGSVSNFFASPAPGSRCIAVGWGALRERGADADQLREVEVPILRRCKHKEDLLGAEICAGRVEGGKDTCQGDSGGPLLCRNFWNPSAWYVAGIVSHGEGCARPGEPGAYTRISLFLDWIAVNANDFKLPAAKPLNACPGFRCTSASKLCIPDKWICNGFTDCLEAEDEKNCTSNSFYSPYFTQFTSGHFFDALKSHKDISDSSGLGNRSDLRATTSTTLELNDFKLGGFSQGANKKFNHRNASITGGQSNNFKNGNFFGSNSKKEASERGKEKFTLSAIPSVLDHTSIPTAQTPEELAKSESETFYISDSRQMINAKDPIDERTEKSGDEATKVDGSESIDVCRNETDPNSSESLPSLTLDVDAKAEKMEKISVINNSEWRASTFADDAVLRRTKGKENESDITKKFEGDRDFEAESTEYFRCREIVQSILKEYHCDGVQDCEDGTDEIECTCMDLLSRTKSDLICDGIVNCFDGSDERNCSPCSHGEFHCRSNDSCLSSSARCDGILNCASGEDENNCFTLSNSAESKFHSSLELPMMSSGFVFRLVDDSWTLLCQDESADFDGKMATEICVNLGWRGYDKYESVISVPNCTAFRVSCSDRLANELHHYRHGENRYHWPWNAFIYADGVLVCSGVLLRFDWLLTSSACLENVSLSTNYLVAKFGSPDPTWLKGDENRLIRIDAVRPLPENRAILLHLAREARPTRFVRPIGIPYVFDSDPKRDTCVAAGEETVFLKISENCSEANFCYEAVAPKIADCSRRVRTGVVVCQSRVGWVPSSTFQRIGGLCGFERFHFASLQKGLGLIHTTINDKIEIIPESLAKCVGFRCPLGHCLPGEKVCDDIPDCPSHKDEAVETCSSISTATGGCETSELKCRNGACISKRFFADGKDDCGDGSDEPETVNCVEYLRLTAPQKICNGKRNCLDKTDEDLNTCSCAIFKFKCGTSELCIPEDFVCDGENDCPEGEDEKKCFGREASGHGKKNIFKIMQKSYGVWHDACRPQMVSPKHADSLCRDLGFEKAGFMREANQTVLVPALDPFTKVRLNPSTEITLRRNKPFMRLVKQRKSCAAISCL